MGGDDWCLSYIISCYKGKGDVLLRESYRGLKPLHQVMEVMEHILATIIRTQVDIDAMQFGFMPGRRTTDAIFILRQVHESISTNIKIFILPLSIWRKLLIVCQGNYCGGP